MHESLHPKTADTILTHGSQATKETHRINYHLSANKKGFRSFLF